MPDMGGGYQMNPQLAKAAAQQVGADPDAAGAADSRASAEEAGYMELEGAAKDSDCQTVNVPGGVSSQAGCCNLWDQAPGAQSFSCGTCTKIRQGAPTSADQQQAGAGGGDQGTTAPSMSASPQIG